MKSTFFFYLALLSYSFSSLAQESIELVEDPDYIKTVTFNKPAEDMIPIYELGSTIMISFDDVIGDEADYYYNIIHYDHDWSPSGLFENEYLDGYDDVRIRDYRNSFTTLQSYSHYELKIPNQFTRGLKVTGNYMIHFFNDNRELIFSRRFMIKEDLVIVGAQVRRTRMVKDINSKQRIEFFIDSSNLLFINPEENLKPVIVQNGDLHTALYGLKPQYNLANKQVYNYDAEASFWAGNEFLNFENKDFRAPNLNIDRVEKAELYNAYLFIDEPRHNLAYTYFPDINGNFIVTTINNDDNAVKAEYVDIHFFADLKGKNIPKNSTLYVYGNYNNYQLQEESKLTYNKSSKLYETTILLKQGFYNYKYVLVHSDGTIDPSYVSGNFWQTENQYYILTYYREPGGRYDQLIGVGSANSIDITN